MKLEWEQIQRSGDSSSNWSWRLAVPTSRTLYLWVCSSTASRLATPRKSWSVLTPKSFLRNQNTVQTPNRMRSTPVPAINPHVWGVNINPKLEAGYTCLSSVLVLYMSAYNRQILMHLTKLCRSSRPIILNRLHIMQCQLKPTRQNLAKFRAPHNIDVPRDQPIVLGRSPVTGITDKKLSRQHGENSTVPSAVLVETLPICLLSPFGNLGT